MNYSLLCLYTLFLSSIILTLTSIFGDIFLNPNEWFFFFLSFKKNCSLFNIYFLRFHLFLDRGEGREKERERCINVWLLLVRPLLRTWPTTQTWALSGNWTSDCLVCRLVLNPLSHTIQGHNWSLLRFLVYYWFNMINQNNKSNYPEPEVPASDRCTPGIPFFKCLIGGGLACPLGLIFLGLILWYVS